MRENEGFSEYWQAAGRRRWDRSAAGRLIIPMDDHVPGIQLTSQLVRHARALGYSRTLADARIHRPREPACVRAQMPPCT